MKKAGVKDYESFCREILTQLKGKPVSFEVFADDYAEMKRQALKIAKPGTRGDKSLYVKIPIINSKGESSIPLIRELSQPGVQLNITALYTLKASDRNLPGRQRRRTQSRLRFRGPHRRHRPRSRFR